MTLWASGRELPGYATASVAFGDGATRPLPPADAGKRKRANARVDGSRYGGKGLFSPKPPFISSLFRADKDRSRWSPTALPYATASPLAALAATPRSETT